MHTGIHIYVYILQRLLQVSCAIKPFANLIFNFNAMQIMWLSEQEKHFIVQKPTAENFIEICKWFRSYKVLTQR